MLNIPVKEQLLASETFDYDRIYLVLFSQTKYDSMWQEKKQKKMQHMKDFTEQMS